LMQKNVYILHQEEHLQFGSYLSYANQRDNNTHKLDQNFSFI
jgi:hypothetical protein